MIQNSGRAAGPLTRENVGLINAVPMSPYIHTPWDGTPNPVHPVMHVPLGAGAARSTPGEEQARLRLAVLERIGMVHQPVASQPGNRLHPSIEATAPRVVWIGTGAGHRVVSAAN